MEESKNEEQSYFYNFDDELMLAYRSTSNTKHKELCMPIVLPPPFKNDDPLVAHWDDGDVRSIPRITWGKYRHMQRSLCKDCEFSLVEGRPEGHEPQIDNRPEG